MINTQIHITSIAKAVQKARRTGKLDLRIIQTFNALHEALEFALEAKANGYDLFDDHIKCLKEELGKLQYKYPDVICNYKVYIPNATGIIPGEDLNNNTAPSVENTQIDIDNATEYQFTVGDFTSSFSDIDGDSWRNLYIEPILPTLVSGTSNTFTNTDGELVSQADGTFQTPIVINIEGLATGEPIDLVFSRSNNLAFSPNTFIFKISDNNIQSLYSPAAIMGVLSSTFAGTNQPPTDIGDNTLYAINRAITVLTLDMFTTGLTPPYNDPEGDLIDAIKILDVSNANQGNYFLNGIEITEGQIITREEINLGLFKHEGPDVDTVSSDVFEFQARDEGSQIWVD